MPKINPKTIFKISAIILSLTIVGLIIYDPSYILVVIGYLLGEVTHRAFKHFTAKKNVYGGTTYEKIFI